MNTVARDRCGKVCRRLRNGDVTRSTLTCSNLVEAIGAYSNKVSLSKYYAELRKRIQEAPPRPRPSGPPPRSKRFIRTDDLTDIITEYEAGATTKHIANRYGISKTRVATLLREHDVNLRRQGLTDEQVSEATDFYTAGRSLAGIAARFDVSPMTVAAALRRQGIPLRPRPGWR
jgi:DNA-binding CsgD family transcriptional regulator